MKRIVPMAAIVASLLAPLALFGPASPAEADVVAVSLPTVVAISSTTLTLTGTVRVDATTSNGLYSAGLWFSYPGDAEPTLIGKASSRRPGFLPITATIDASRIVPGPNQVDVVDPADGDSRTITIDLRRKSRVSITHARFRAHGKVALALRVTHFDPKVGGYMPSQLSPVKLQENLDGVWTPLAGVTTDTLGLASAVLPGGAGVHYYRAIRPDGATVWTATSRTLRAGRGIVATSLPASAAIPSSPSAS